MELHLKIIGVILVLLAISHIIFPGYFKWKAEFRNVSLINRQMMYVHTFFIALIVFLMGILCLGSSNELATTDFGRKVSLGLGIFFGIRLIVQFYVYSPRLWKGKAFETSVHVLFGLVWLYISMVFLGIYFYLPWIQ